MEVVVPQLFRIFLNNKSVFRMHKSDAPNCFDVLEYFVYLGKVDVLLFDLDRLVSLFATHISLTVIMNLSMSEQNVETIKYFLLNIRA